MVFTDERVPKCLEYIYSMIWHNAVYTHVFKAVYNIRFMELKKYIKNGDLFFKKFIQCFHTIKLRW